ncbi:MAG: hypothetical protein Q8M40_02855 [Legionella sp.]|nr:hypothetical protein [Legionella sp.]
MKWNIPAKTFLLGEYAAVAEASAIILTTSPCFELELTSKPGLTNIHQESPAGSWWHANGHKSGLVFSDPYKGQGGLGASSAQFLGAYLAHCDLTHHEPAMSDMLQAYYKSSWSGKGLRPSGYDVIAQSQNGCVYINKGKNNILSYDWPFENLSFILLHTGVKLATHHHLQDAVLPDSISELSAIVDKAKNAFDQCNEEQIIKCINDYHNSLVQLNLIASHSLNFINLLKTYPEVLAIKGCGALGADIILILTPRNDLSLLKNKLSAANWQILATEENLTNIKQNALIKNRV